MGSRLERTAGRVTDLALPRASIGIVAAVVLAGELIAMTLAWGATTVNAANLDDVVVTLAVVGAASAALGQLTRSGHVSEPGHRWLLAAWVVIAALASTGLADLPLGLTENPAGLPDIDRALLLSATWTLVLAGAVLGADQRPDAKRLPIVLGAVALVAGLAGGAIVGVGDLLRPTGPTTPYVLMVAVVLVVCLVTLVLWLTRWQTRGGWSLTWSGTALLLATTGLLLQLVAEFGNERIWVAATGMVVSSMIVPGLGAFAAGTALASAHTLARRQLREDLDTSSAAEVSELPMLQSLQVRLAPVLRLDGSTPIGWLAHAELPGLSVDWWRSQAATMGLGSRLEAALAARAIEVVAAEADPATWVVVPVRADAIGDDLASVLRADVTGNLVVVVRGAPSRVAEVLPRLAEHGVTTGVVVTGMDVRAMDAIDRADPALLVLDASLAGGVAHDHPRRAAAQAAVAWADSRQRGVLAIDVDDPADLDVLGELGVRYAAGRATAGAAVGAGLEPDPDAVGLIEAAGLREPPVPGRS